MLCSHISGEKNNKKEEECREQQNQLLLLSPESMDRNMEMDILLIRVFFLNILISS